jgi:hypothetical protein
MPELEEVVEENSKELLVQKILRKLKEPFIDFEEYCLKWLGFIDEEGRELEPGFVNSSKNLSAVLLGYFTTLPFFTLAHESLHSITTKVLGFRVENFNLESAGTLFQKIFPWISMGSGNSIEHLNIKDGVLTYPSLLENSLIFLAPYVLTPIGIALMHKGKREKSPFLMGMGFGAAFSPFFNITGDLYKTSKLILNSINILFNATASVLTAISIYDISKYAVRGFEYLVSKFKREKPEEQKPGLLKRMFNSAKCYVGIAALALGLGYLGNPNRPEYSVEVKARIEQIKELYDNEEYEKSLELAEKLGENPEYRIGLFEIICDDYAKLVLDKKRTEQEALNNLTDDLHTPFYLLILKEQIKREEYQDAKETLEKIDSIIDSGYVKRALKPVRNFIRKKTSQ